MRTNLIALLLVGLLSPTCFADLIGLPPYVPVSYSGTLEVQGAGQTTVTNNTGINIVTRTPVGDESRVGYGAVVAGPNYLGVAATAAVASNTFPGASLNAEALAYETDHLYLTNAPQQGILALLVSMLGVTYNTGSGSFGLESEILYRDSTYESLTSQPGTSCVSDKVSGCGPLFVGLGFLYVPYSLDSSGTTIFIQEFLAYNFCDVTPTASGSGSTCSSNNDYFDPVQIASITVEDVNGNPVPGATVTSLGGIDYSLPQEVTPEPSTLVMFGTGLIGAIAAARHRLAA